MGLDDTGLILEEAGARAGSFTLGPIDLSVRSGRTLAVLGPSGAGKSVLLETIAGFRALAAGGVSLGGRKLSGLPPEARRIGFVFQDAALFPHLSVRKNVEFPLRARGEPPRERVEALLTRFDISHLAERSPRSLSGGERQRVALARALAAQPELLLLDEPLSALDRPTREDLREVLKQLLEGLRIPAVHVTHDRDEALTIGDEVAIIAAGRVRQVGGPLETVANPADQTCARLLGWSELGAGNVAKSLLSVGNSVLPLPKMLGGLDGPVDAFYRPEAVLLGPDARREPGTTWLPAVVDRVLPTTPLVRITFVDMPTLTALVLPRDLDRFELRAGATVELTLPAGSLRVFPAA